MSLRSRSSSDTLSGRPEARSAAIPSALSGLILASTPIGVPSALVERALPADAETIADFVDAMAEIRAPATVRRYVASIAIVHRVVGFGKTVSSPLVRLAVAAYAPTQGAPPGPGAGPDFAVAAAPDRGCGGPSDRRPQRALLAVAYDAMLRRAELTSLQVADLVEEIRGDATLLVRRSKTDGEGCGEIVYLARDTVALLRTWLDCSGTSNGRLFRSVGKGGKVGDCLDPSQVPRIFKAMARRAGLSAAVVQGLSGHSARVGAALQDMIAAGIELPAILQAGRWKSTAMVNGATVSGYSRTAAARRSSPGSATAVLSPAGCAEATVGL